MTYLKFSLGIFLVLAVSRFIPHPPNFTSLIALSFYVPVFFGRKYISIVLLSFFITDIFIGLHSVTFFTWGSVLIIGLISKYFKKSINLRIIGSLMGATLFFIITNFGVWILGSYGHTFNGLVLCYTLALPFFTYSLISTLLFSCLFETFYKFGYKFIKV